MEKFKFKCACTACGNYALSVERIAQTDEEVLAECEICGAFQSVNVITDLQPPIFTKTTTPEDADAALKAIYTGANTLIEHAETTGTVFCGVVTIDRGRGDLGAGDFFIGAPADIAAAFERLFKFRPELADILKFAIAQHEFAPFRNNSMLEGAGPSMLAGHDPYRSLYDNVTRDAMGKEVDLRNVKVYLDNIAPDPELLKGAPVERDTMDTSACPRCGKSNYNGDCNNCHYPDNILDATRENCAECGGATFNRECLVCGKHQK